MAVDVEKLVKEERELLEAIAEAGKTPYEYAKSAMIGVMCVDHQLIAAVEKKYGAAKAIEMHRKKWEPLIAGAFKAAKETLGIDKVDDIDKLLRIRMFLNDGTPCPSKIKEEPGRGTMTVVCCPFIQVAREIFGEDLNSTWLQAAAASEKWLYGHLIKLAGLEDKVVATVDRFACLRKEDHICRGVYEYLPGTGGAGGASSEVFSQSGERFGDCRDLTLDEALDYCMAVTDMSPEAQAISSARALFSAVYYTWRCLHEEFGPEIAEELYWEVWKQLLLNSYKNTLQKMGVKSPKTARELGRIHKQFLLDTALKVKVVKDTEDEWIVDVLWCPNPELGPADVHARRMAYYHTEYVISVKVNEYFIELAGLQDEVEHEQPTGYCAFAHDYDCNKNCRMIYRKKQK